MLVEVTRVMELPGRGKVVWLSGLRIPLKRNTPVRRGDDVWHVVSEAWFSPEPAAPLGSARPLLVRGDAPIAAGETLEIEP